MSTQDESFFPFLPYLNIFTIPTKTAQSFIWSKQYDV